MKSRFKAGDLLFNSDRFIIIIDEKSFVMFGRGYSNLLRCNINQILYKQLLRWEKIEWQYK